MLSPPLAQVAAALRKTTEVLARELAAPTNDPPPWTEFEWRIARAAAAMHGVSSLLCERLRWEGPTGWSRFLQGQRDQTLARHQKISQLLIAIDSRARAEGVPVIALKGAALHALGLYTPGRRPMGDIDLLVRDGDAREIARALELCDYKAAFTTHRHEVFKARIISASTAAKLGEHVDSPINIEVHIKIAEQLPVKEIDITRLLSPAVARAGINAYASNVSLMLHLLLHAAGNMRARALRLIQLHDIALFAARFDPADWQELLAVRPDGGAPWWTLAPLMLVERYYPATVPLDLFAQLRGECPRLLVGRTRRQRLADISWSNIRIEAFPGLEWSRTPREALDFMRSRIWPGRAARLELAEGAAQIPDSSTIPWYGMSHGTRILRWIFSRPPRVQTLLSVRAALAHEG